MLETIKIFDLEFKYHLDRYKYSSRYANEKDFVSREEHRNEGVKHLKTLQNVLEKNNSKQWTFVFSSVRIKILLKLFSRIKLANFKYPSLPKKMENLSLIISFIMQNIIFQNKLINLI